ncbi:hypothetical protein BR63_05805 [Thermanaerosceptrum fracticalcis]|uniref:DZANK-type domain-containing protein n=1 Tax=Thermanaerosceptrum fracticalcis TaxID=1712410 RepID=A0A7G6E1B9_THEFR|nr:hypothetical protein [Thermanaerosceptrum fracticalcis]QNB45873.1 hypothetical protein BR63_05805 [Thermanaerosceptrum fracticalcis]
MEGRTDMCLKCQNKEFSDYAKFCKMCGTPLLNTCTDEKCAKVNIPDAWHCEYCGAPTLFGSNGLLAEYENSFGD